MSDTPPQDTPSPSGKSPAAVFGAILRWGAVGYLVLVLAVTIFVAVSLQLTASEPDANLVGVYLIGVTLPLSILVAPLNMATLDLTGTPALMLLAATGAVQAAASWGLGRLVARKEA